MSEANDRFFEHLKEVCDLHNFDLKLDVSEDPASRAIQAIIQGAQEIIRLARTLNEAK